MACLQWRCNTIEQTSKARKAKVESIVEAGGKICEQTSEEMDDIMKEQDRQLKEYCESFTFLNKRMTSNAL